MSTNGGVSVFLGAKTPWRHSHAATCMLCTKSIPKSDVGRCSPSISHTDIHRCPTTQTKWISFACFFFFEFLRLNSCIF